MLAAFEGHVDAFRTLIEKGARVDDVNKNGETVVHLAAGGNHVDLLRVSVLCGLHVMPTTCTHMLQKGYFLVVTF